MIYAPCKERSYSHEVTLRELLAGPDSILMPPWTDCSHITHKIRTGQIAQQILNENLLKKKFKVVIWQKPNNFKSILHKNPNSDLTQSVS